MMLKVGSQSRLGGIAPTLKMQRTIDPQVEACLQPHNLASPCLWDRSREPKGPEVRRMASEGGIAQLRLWLAIKKEVPGSEKVLTLIT